MEIRIENLNKKVGKLHILKDVNLTFKPDGINVVIGPNGAGKTSLLRIIGNLDYPTSGYVYYDGVSLFKLSFKDKLKLRRKIGFVFQNPVLLGGTVYQNILYGLKFRGCKINKEEVEKVIMQVGLLDKINHNAENLSGGEKQRLQLARVLILNPDLFIFDEPTSNLDPISTKTIENIILQLCKSKKNIILSTHNLIQARHLGKNMFFFKDGKLIQEGEVEEIFKTPSSIDIAEFSQSENIIFGEIIREGNEVYLSISKNVSSSTKVDKEISTKINVITNLPSGSAVGVIRPEDILISLSPFSSSARNCFKGIIKNIEDIGSLFSVSTRCGNLVLTSYVTKQSIVSMNLTVGTEVYLIFKATSVHLIPV